MWPWVSDQRWCPQPGDDSVSPTPVALLDLTVDPRASAADTFESRGRGEAAVWLLSVQLETALLQVPLVARQEPIQPTGPSEEQNADLVEGRAPIAAADGLLLFDGATESDFWQAWLRRATIVGADSDLLLEAAGEVRPLGVEQSNSSVQLGSGSGPKFVAKLFRVLHAGQHPEVELPKELAAAGFNGVPTLRAYWDAPLAPGGTPACSGVVAEKVEAAKDGFQLFASYASRDEDPSALAYKLGEVVREMHDHLSELGSAPPIGLQDAYQRVLCSAPNVRLAKPYLDDPNQADQLLRQIRYLTEAEPTGDQASWPVHRVHGDLHLGQTLSSDVDWFVLDFEGEPMRPLSERTQPDTPLRDVAGMLRSFDYAWHEGGAANPQWPTAAREAFKDGYFGGDQQRQEAVAQMLGALELEKAIYEVAYEATFRPELLPVPLAAVEALIQA